MIEAAVGGAGLDGLIEAIYTYTRWMKSVFTNHTLAFTGSRASDWDAAGAAHFGFKVVWINRLGQKAERVSGRADAELDSLRGYRHCSCSQQFGMARYLQFNRPNV